MNTRRSEVGLMIGRKVERTAAAWAFWAEAARDPAFERGYCIERRNHFAGELAEWLGAIR